jgi:hypothetical protein
MEYTFKVTQSEADTIVTALAQLPFHAVAGLINNLQQQALEQRNKYDIAEEKSV